LNREIRHRVRGAWWTVGAFALSVILVVGLKPALFPRQVASPVDAAEPNTLVYLPLSLHGYVPPEGKLCRFGVGATSGIGDYEINSLSIGWYLNFRVTSTPDTPGGITYMPVIRLTQTGVLSYTHTPDDAGLEAFLAAYPGSVWLVGNEPDRRDFQDDLEPDVYAMAYGDLYHFIKSRDPTARVAAGGIVQPTPLRMAYLDAVLSAYESQYGVSMPVDVWNIHAYILREQSCQCDPTACWGAGIPPGSDACYGELYEIEDNDNIQIFKQNIINFRAWMSERGYQDVPLIITEFGVQMWSDLGFPPARVNAFMDEAFDFLLTASDPATGYPADDYRLVQRWAWYSLSDKTFNGWLFDPATKQRSTMGDNFAVYTSQVVRSLNLKPLDVWADAEPVSGTASLTVTVHARVANNGNFAVTKPFVVGFFEGDPQQGGIPIGEQVITQTLDGCADWREVQVVWAGIAPGAHTVAVVVDTTDVVSESQELDNTLIEVLEVYPPP